MRALLGLAILVLPVLANAADDEQLIESLLTAVGTSDCTFIRNGKEYPAKEAEDHLRMKYRRGKRYVSNVDTFIKRIATKSSMSGKPYRIRCESTDAIATADWLSMKLDEIRKQSS